MSAALDMRFFTSSNASNFHKRIAIAIKPIFSRRKCSNATISTPSLTQFHPTMYEDQLQININVFFFDNEGNACHPLVISRKNYERVANFLYWKDHYAPITSIPRLFADITKHKPQKHFCLRCLGHFSSEEVLARHKELCIRDDFMSVLHVLPTPGSKQEQLKFYNYKFCTMAPFLIYADFESILEPLGRQTKLTIYSQQHKVCAAAAILFSTLGQYNQLTVIKVGEKALSEFLDVLIEWETAIVEELRTNRPMKRMSAMRTRRCSISAATRSRRTIR